MAQRKPEDSTTLNQVLQLVEKLSADDQEQLRLRLNMSWVFRPENKAMDELRRQAHAALQHANVSVEDLKLEVERIKEERLAERYPGLGE